MKKTLLLSALVASVASFASVTGFVEAYDSSTTIHAKGLKLTELVKSTTSTFGIKGEVKVSDSGFSAGGDLKVKNYMLFKDASDGASLLSRALMKESKVWAKYELPQLKGVDTYVKGTYNVSGSVELEADAKYKKGDLTVELNSKTKLPLGIAPVYKSESKEDAAVKAAVDAKTMYDKQHEYLENVVSTHKLSIEKEKMSAISDLKASVEVQHSYANRLETKVKDGNEFILTSVDADDAPYESAFKYVKGEVSGAYNGVKDLEVKAELGLAYTPQARGFKIDGEYTDEETMKKEIPADVSKTLKTIYGFTTDKAVVLGNISDKLFIDAKYTGVKDLEITGRTRLTHSVVLGDTNLNHVLFDLKVGVKYTGISNTALTGSVDFLLDSKGGSKRENSIVLVADLGAKYDYKATDKLTISPELNIKGMLFNADDTILGLSIAPKVSVEYMPIEKLTLKGSVETPVVFSNIKTKDHKMEYIGTAVKTSFNVKYAW